MAGWRGENTVVARARRGPRRHARPVVAIGTTEPPGESSFEIPEERWAALDEAGFGWMFSGDGYPAQPEGVAWPTEEWPAGELPDGFDAAAIDEFLSWALDPPEGESCCIDAVVAVHGGELVLERMARDGIQPSRTCRGRWPSRSPRRCSASWSPRGASTCSGRRRYRSGRSRTIPATRSRSTRCCTCAPGLEWVEEYDGTSDVIEMLFGEGSSDRAHFAADRPLAAPPGDAVELLDRHLDDLVADHRR